VGEENIFPKKKRKKGIYRDSSDAIGMVRRGVFYRPRPKGVI
jgi:hypothetical protein